jgi:hypothetical protein
MDAFGVFFLILFLIIIITSIVIFIKRLKKNGINHFKYKLIFSLFCFFSVIVILIFYYFFQYIILINLFKLKIDNNTYTNRIITMVIVMILNITVNFYLLKFYSKRIYLREISKINEIELIGKE